jgi:hypothetical protein
MRDEKLESIREQIRRIELVLRDELRICTREKRLSTDMFWGGKEAAYSRALRMVNDIDL